MPSLACVGSFSTREAAEVARCALQAKGIEATVSAEDTTYNITLAHGGARLFVDVNSVDDARHILTLTALESHGGDSTGAKPIQFSLRALFFLTAQVAFTATGYAVGGFEGAVSLFLAPILVIIGVRVLLSLEGRRPFKRFFVAITGLGFLIAALAYLLHAFLG
jgi:hypothetical protein